MVSNPEKGDQIVRGVFGQTFTKACQSTNNILEIRVGTGQHFCSPARPEVTRNRPAQTVYAKPQIIFWPVARNVT